MSDNRCSTINEMIAVNKIAGVLRILEHKVLGYTKAEQKEHTIN
jgi:hypothetical protein